MATGNTLKRVDEAGIRGKGIQDLWDTLVDYLQSLEDSIAEYKTAVDELIDDHATFKTAVDELNTLTDELRSDHAVFITLTDEIKTDMNANNNIYDVHTHECSNSDATAARCSTPDTGAAENSLTASAASALAADLGSANVSTITAGEATAGPATITASKAKTAEDLSAKYLAKT